MDCKNCCTALVLSCSHYRTQYTDGLKGNLLIRDPFAATYGAEPSVTVSDWYHVNSKAVTNAAMFNYVSLHVHCRV